MDSVSFLLFLIYAIVTLIILVYVSPIISAFLMLTVPVISIFLLPEASVQFFTIQQSTFMGVPIYNIHIMLLIWSALIGIIVYSELLSWYLLLDKVPPGENREKPPLDSIQTETPKTTKNRIEELLLKLGKIMSGEK